MSGIIWTSVVLFHIAVFGYFAMLHSYYLVMSVYAFRQLRRYLDRVRAVDLMEIAEVADLPPVTLIVPAYNEEQTCLEASRSLLSLEYPHYEVIVVNDGSTDATLSILQEAYGLKPCSRYPTSQIATATVRGIYQSTKHAKLWVLDKENAGRSDALNAAINHCTTPLFCTIDADTVLESDSILRLVRPFLEDERTIASGGIVRIANGCTIVDGRVADVRMPKSWLARFQVLEYLRSFLAGRVAWDALEIMLLISGAFGMFRREAVADLGGFETESVGEDLELTVRLHRHYREEGRSYRISFVPDPVAWTECPETVRQLGKQRDRWQRGLMETMFANRDMLLNPRFGRIGYVAYPYFFFFEMLGPIVEIGGYLSFALLAATGYVSWGFAGLFLVVAVLLGTVLSMLSVGLEEMSFRRYTSLRDLLRLFGLALFENLGYRQMQCVFRLKGIYSYLRGERGWGTMERKGFQGIASGVGA